MSIIELLAKGLNKKESEVLIFLEKAPNKYKVYTIPKRTQGRRVIAQPSRELKEYQRFYIKELQAQLPIHPSAKAYRKGIGIKENAIIHQQHSYLLKMDLENFFNSINPELFWNTWRVVKGQIPQEHERSVMEKLLFWRPSKKNTGKLILSIGAPSSPFISNFCMFKFDELITGYCLENKISYSRYADDLTFSTNKKEILFLVPKIVQEVLMDCFGQRLTVNRGKTVFSSKAHNRHVTGITINNNGELSLGRERKRYIKHLVNKFKYKNLDLDEVISLKGLLSHAKHIDPKFVTALKLKYSERLIKEIFEVNNE